MYQHFQQTLNQGRAATDACPTGDGVCNLLKYAYGLDPTTVDTRKFNPIEGPASGGLPRLWKGYDGDKRRIGLRFPRRRAITGPGIRYVLEESPDLNEWTEVSSPGEIVFAMEGEWEDVAMHVPLLDEGARFQRVRIELTVELLRLQRDLNAVEGWMYRHFEQTLNLGSAAIDACPAGDGITNLLKYAYGLSPTKVDKREFNPADGPASGGLPRLWQTQADDSRRMGLRFPRRKATTEPGIRYVLEESGDLKAWTEVPTPGETLFATDDEWEDVALHVPVLSKGARFLRVRIELTVALLP